MRCGVRGADPQHHDRADDERHRKIASTRGGGESSSGGWSGGRCPCVAPVRSRTRHDRHRSTRARRRCSDRLAVAMPTPTHEDLADRDAGDGAGGHDPQQQPQQPWWCGPGRSDEEGDRVLGGEDHEVALEHGRSACGSSPRSIRPGGVRSARSLVRRSSCVERAGDRGPEVALGEFGVHVRLLVLGGSVVRERMALVSALHSAVRCPALPSGGAIELPRPGLVGVPFADEELLLLEARGG